MIDLRDEILIDFIAEAEDYYQVVQEAMATLRQGQVREGVAAMLRPLHTIKGTAGFIEGLEKLKTHTHQVEDILKRLQGESTPPSATVADATVRAVDEVFNLLEQVKRGATELDDGEAQEVLATLRRALDGEAAAPSSIWFPPRVLTDNGRSAQGQGEDQVVAGLENGVLMIAVRTFRLHLAWQCYSLAETLAKADPKYPVAIDLSMVRTVSSTAWGEIWQASEGHEVVLIGLRPAVEATYQAWGLSARMRAYPDTSTFWATHSHGSPAGGGVS